jgi:hypothetical protein
MDDTLSIIEKLWERKEWRYTHSKHQNLGSFSSRHRYDDGDECEEFDDGDSSDDVSDASSSDGEEGTVSEASDDYSTNCGEPYRAQYYEVGLSHRHRKPKTQPVKYEREEVQRLPWRTNAQCQQLIEEAVQLKSTDGNVHESTVEVKRLLNKAIKHTKNVDLKRKMRDMTRRMNHQVVQEQLTALLVEMKGDADSNDVHIILDELSFYLMKEAAKNAPRPLKPVINTPVFKMLEETADVSDDNDSAEEKVRRSERVSDFGQKDYKALFMRHPVGSTTKVSSRSRSRGRGRGRGRKGKDRAWGGKVGSGKSRAGAKISGAKVGAKVGGIKGRWGSASGRVPERKRKRSPPLSPSSTSSDESPRSVHEFEVGSEAPPFVNGESNSNSERQSKSRRTDSSAPALGSRQASNCEVARRPSRGTSSSAVGGSSAGGKPVLPERSSADGNPQAQIWRKRPQELLCGLPAASSAPTSPMAAVEFQAAQQAIHVRAAMRTE